MDLLALAELYLRKKNEEFVLEQAIQQINALTPPDYQRAAREGVQRLGERLKCHMPLPFEIRTGTDYAVLCDEVIAHLEKNCEQGMACDAPPPVGMSVVVVSFGKDYNPNYSRERCTNFPEGTKGIVWRNDGTSGSILVEFSADKKYEWSKSPNWNSSAYGHLPMPNNVGDFHYSELLIDASQLKAELANYGGGRKALERIVTEEFGKAEAETGISQYTAEVRQKVIFALDKMAELNYTLEQKQQWVNDALTMVGDKLKQELLRYCEEK